MPGQVTHFYVAARIAREFSYNGSDDVMPCVTNGIRQWIAANKVFHNKAIEANSVSGNNGDDMLDAAMSAYRSSIMDSEDIAVLGAFAAGAVGPDLWTIPSNIGDGAINTIFEVPINGGWYFDMGHYNCSQVFPVYLLRRIQQNKTSWDTLQRKYRTAYILGYISHICTDIICHPLVNVFAGAYHQQKQDVWELEAPGIAQFNVFNDHNKIEHYWDGVIKYLCFEGYHPAVNGFKSVRATNFGHAVDDDWFFPNYRDFWDDYLSMGVDDLDGEDETFLNLSTSLPGPFAHRYDTDDNSRKVEPFIREYFYDAYKQVEEFISEDHEGSLHPGNVANELEKLEFFYLDPGFAWITTQENYLDATLPSLEDTFFKGPQFFSIPVLGDYVRGAIQLGKSYITKALDFVNSSAAVPALETDPEPALQFLYNWNLDTGSAIRIRELGGSDGSDPSKTVPVCIDFVNVFNDPDLQGFSLPALQTEVWKNTFKAVDPPKTLPVAATPPPSSGPVKVSMNVSAGVPLKVCITPSVPLMVRLTQVTLYDKDADRNEIDARFYGSEERNSEPWVIIGDDSSTYTLKGYQIDKCVEDFINTLPNSTRDKSTSLGKAGWVYTSTYLGGTGEVYIADGDSETNPEKYFISQVKRPHPRHIRVAWCRKYTCTPNNNDKFEPDEHDRHHTAFPSEEIVISVFALCQMSSGAYRDLYHDVEFTQEQFDSLLKVKVVGINCVVLLFKTNEQGIIRICEAWVDGQMQMIEKESAPVKPPPPPPPPPEVKPHRIRMIGMSFDTSKCFILPDAMNGIKGMVDIYKKYPDSELLIVGHTDTAGKPDYNDPLSLERAESVRAYLQDDVDAWLDWYDKQKHSYEKVWGKTEDQYMLERMSDYETFSKDPHGVVWGYQKARGLDTDNDCGPDTRRQLITDYMAKDGTSLPPGVFVTTHGCGESFPQDPTPDGTADPDNRRVELFLFPKSTGGIQPKPTGPISPPGSTEYPQWVALTPDPVDFTSGEPLVEQLYGVINMKLYCAQQYTELANCAYSISGDEWSISGTSDANGCLRHEDVPFGSYTLTVAGRAETCNALVLDQSRDEPQVMFV